MSEISRATENFIRPEGWQSSDGYIRVFSDGSAWDEENNEVVPAEELAELLAEQAELRAEEMSGAGGAHA